MAKSKTLIISYLDGREDEEVLAGPKAQVMAERHFGHSLVNMDTVEQAYYLGWCALTVAKRCDVDYDTFLDTLDDVDVPETDKAKLAAVVRPIKPGQQSVI
jgi:hypothetical protein